MVKWLKIDKRQDEATPSGRSGKSPFIIFPSKQAIITDERECKPLRKLFFCSLGKTE